MANKRSGKGFTQEQIEAMDQLNAEREHLFKELLEQAFNAYYGGDE